MRGEEKKEDAVLAFVNTLGLRTLPIWSEPGLKEMVNAEFNRLLPQEVAHAGGQGGPRELLKVHPVWSSGLAC